MTSRLILASLLLMACCLPAQAGDWSLESRDGTQYTLSGLHGRWVLVNFWAPWCPPCLAEMPEFDAMQKQHQDLQVIGVAVMYHNREQVSEAAKAVSYPIVFGDEDIASDFGGMTGLPTSFLYTPEGKLAGRHEGPLTQTEIEQAINGNSAAFFN